MSGVALGGREQARSAVTNNGHATRLPRSRHREVGTACSLARVSALCSAHIRNALVTVAAEFIAETTAIKPVHMSEELVRDTGL